MNALLMLALVVAVPRAGQVLPPVDHAYVIGAVNPGVTNVTVGGQAVDVYRTGAWAAYVDVREGENTIPIRVDGFLISNHTFRVAAKPKKRANAAPAKPPVYEKLAYADDEPRASPQGKAPGEIVVYVDPGHGGSDTGAVSPHGWLEKDANLALALALRDELAKRGYDVRMTREDDRALVLKERPHAAHEAEADAFISIHHNAPPADRDAAKLRYFSAHAWNPIGTALAQSLERRARAALAETVPSNGTLSNNFAVTRSPEIPSCLVEADFITSPAGEETAWDPAARRRLAAALAEGFADWVGGEKTASENLITETRKESNTP